MRRLFHVLALLVIGLSPLCWVLVGVSSYADTTPQEYNYTLIDDYWPMEDTGPGRLVYATEETDFWSARADGSPLDPVHDVYGNSSWGDDVDRRIVVVWRPGYAVWDLEDAFSSVVVFSQVDNPGLLPGSVQYAVFHADLWGSNDFDVSNPGAATWTAARLYVVYAKGWSNVGEGTFDVCNDDYTMVWRWDDSSGVSQGYRFVKVQSSPYAQLRDPEVDAIKGVLGSQGAAGCAGWETDVVEEGRVFSDTSLKVGTDNRVHLAYGEEQLYYALRDDSTWHVQEVDKQGTGAYCSLALNDLDRPAISYYDAANGDLKYAYQNGTLNDVWGSSASDIYAVGDSGTIIHYDGAKWSPMAGGNTQALYGIWGSGRNWSAGDRIYAVGAGGTIIRFNGTSWSSPMIVPGGTPALNGVWGSSSSDVFAVGSGGIILHYDGSAWSTMSSGTSYALNGVWGSSSSDVFAVGYGGIILHYGGSAWSAMASGTTTSLNGVWGSSGSDVYTVGDLGVIRRYNGTSWTSVYSPVTDCLGDVWGSSTSDVFAVGCRGTVIHFGGTSWSQMISDTTNRLYGVWGISATSVVAVGYEGAIISYDGTIWTQITSGNGWLTQTVDSLGNVGQYTSLAFYGGSPSISYYDATNGDLKYARWNPATGAWVKEAVDSLYWVGEYTSLAFDGLGRAAISYYDATYEDLKLAWWDGECWQIETIDYSGDVGRYSSLAFDYAENPAVAYHNATLGTLKLARWNGTAWEIETVDNEGWVGQYASLAFDSSNQPGISYYDALNQNLKYAHRDATGWDVATVDADGNVGSHTSMDFDSSDSAVISYYDATNDALKVAGVEGDRWGTETVDTYPWPGRFSSLAFDLENNAAISYYDAREGELKYALWQKDHWVIERVDVYGDVGRYTSLKFDGSDNASISYYEVSRGDLKYAHWSGSAWDISTVDSAGDVGSYSSLAFDSDGNPAIAYYDATNGDLKFSHWNGGAWVRSVVDAVGDVGSFASLDFDISGNPGISYYDATNRKLKYAHFDGTAWVIDIVDSVGDVGRAQSLGDLRFDCVGNPAISYYDAVSGDLKYAHWSGTDWVLQIVDSEGQVGLYSSLEFDGSKRPAISYHDASNGALKLARWNGEKWDLVTIDDTHAAGHYTSLAFDRCGWPAVSYDSPLTGDLKYALPSNPEPNQPVNTLPAHGTTYVSLTPVLECGAFADPCTDSHRASQWLIATENCEINCGLVFDSGVDESNLLKIQVPSNILLPYTTYYWCVRHQDCHGAWSQYSAKTAFTTESPPQRPVNMSPEDGAEGVSMTPTLVASGFSDPEAGDRHVASQWQLWSSTGDNATPLLDQTTQGGSLTQFSVPAGILTDNMSYYWRVRYQDDHGAWSELSVETSFSTTHRPDQPVNLEPADGASGVGLTPTLESSPFADPDPGETHQASQWRVTKIAGDYSTPVFDSGADMSNLNRINIPSGNLEEGTSYYWQVRYQDSQGAWSSWSAETDFGTRAPPAVPAALVVAAAVVAVLVVGGITASMVAPL